MQRLSKEYNLNISNNISIKYGTVNKDNPQVIYLSGKCWIKPLFEDTYDNIINAIKKDFKHKVFSFVFNDKLFTNNFILDFNLDSDKLQFNKSKFMSFNIFFKQYDKNIISINNDIFKNKFDGLINDFLELFVSNDFLMSKSK